MPVISQALRERPAAAGATVDHSVVAALLTQTDLVQKIAALTCEALRRTTPPGGEAPSAALVKGVAARVAAGLAVALMESDLAERIAAQLAERSAFAEGWRACPE